MLHPLFSTLVHRPDLVAEHLSAYAGLLQAEASEAGSQWLQRGLSWALVAAAALLFLVFAGLALMLGLLLSRFHWVLVAVPGLFLLLAVLAYTRAKASAPTSAFADLKAQFDSDVRALRSVR